MKNTQITQRGSRWIACLTAAVMVAGFAVTVTVSAAEADKDPKREARRAQAQLSAVQKEKAVLAAQLEDLKKQLSDLGSKSAVLEKKTGGQRKQVAELTEKYEEAEKNLQLMTQQFADTSKTLQQLQKEKEQEQKQLSGDIQVCEKKNSQLYQISTELMDKYRAKGLFSVLLLAEPFTQLESVKMQNLIQEYQDKSEAAKITTTRVSASLPLNDEPVKDAGTASASNVQDAPRP